MRKNVENLRELSPLVLKRRVEQLRRKIPALQAQMRVAKEKDEEEGQWPIVVEKAWPQWRAELIEVREMMAELLKNPQNMKGQRFSFMGLVLGKPFEPEYTSEAKCAYSQLYRRREKLESNLRLKDSDPIPEAHQNPFLGHGPETCTRHQDRVQGQIDALNAEIRRHLEALSGDAARLERLEAVEARMLQKGRGLASKLRLTFTPTDDCPYCGMALGSNPRLDHIYPISKGGLSVSANLVFVCWQCNQKKSNLTLAQFVRTYKLDRQAVEERLTQLGKQF